MTQDVEDRLYELNIWKKYEGCFKYFNYEINFNEIKPFTNRRDYIDIYDQETNQIIHYYEKFKIGYTDIFDPKNTNWDKLLMHSLFKIISDIPIIEKKKNNLKQIQEIKSETYFKIDEKPILVDKLTVFQYSKVSTKCIRYRPGKEDTYKYDMEISWFALLDYTIIQSNYISSLLPKKVSKSWTEKIFGSTPTGGTRFEVNLEETKTFKDKLKFSNFNLCGLCE